MELIVMDKPFDIHIVEATSAHVDEMLALIKELAAYERSSEEVTISAEDLLRDGFGNPPSFYALLAKVNGVTVGMAFWYFTYSTWKGKELYLEDLVVKKDWRGKGIGRKLFEELMKRAFEHKVKRMRWQVLHWNTPAIGFYKQYQTFLSDQWLNCMLSDNDIRKWVEK